MIRKTISGGLAIAAITLFALNSHAMDYPESVDIDSLTNHYEAVTFDHSMHVEATENDCAVCHHHTTGTPPTDERCIRCHKDSSEADAVACADCHSAQRFSAEYLKKIETTPLLFHRDKPGLKGAYHQKCLGCHQEMDAPTGCQDCHTRNEKGDKFFHSGAFAPAPKENHGAHH